MADSGVLYGRSVLIDSSAAIALLDGRDQFHREAKAFFESARSLSWCAIDVTSHEAFTRVRYGLGLTAGLAHFDFLRADPITLLDFSREDEHRARQILVKFEDQKLSFHDALCAAIMKRRGIYRVFSFDRDFWILGFQVEPGVTAAGTA